MGLRDLAYRAFVNPFLRRRQKMADAKRESGRHGAPHGSLAKGVLSDLVRSEPKDVEELATEMDKDYQVALARQTLAANIASVPVSINVDGGDARASELADSLKLLWDQSLKSMQEAIAFGRVAYEKIWDYDADHNLHVLRKLEPLPFGQTSMLLLEGSFDGIELKWGDGKDERLTLAPNKSWWLAIDPTALEPHGRSRYLGAPQETWKERRQARESLVKFIRRYVFRGGVGYAPESYVDENNQPIDPMQDLQNVIENLFAGGSVVLPNTRNKVTKDYEYEFTESPTTLDPAPLLNVISAEDVEQLRSFGIPEKCVTEGQAVGSFAMVTSQMLILFAVVEGLLDQFVESFQKYVIDKAVEVNWAENAPKITISFPSLTKKPGSILAEVVKAILTSPQLSPLLVSGGVDLQQLLETAGIPLSDDVAQRLLALYPKQKLDPTGEGGSDVQQTALNGAQISSLLEIVTQAALRQIPLESARQTVIAAFPALSQQTIDAIMRPLAKFVPAQTAGGPNDMANTLPPDPLPAVPTQRELVDAAIAELARLYDQLREALRRQDTATLQATLFQIRSLRAETQLAAQVLGMVSAASANPDQAPARVVTPPPQPKDLAIVEAVPYSQFGSRTQGFRYTFMDDAVDWLLSKRVMSHSDFRALTDQQKRAVFTASGVDDTALLNQLKLEVAVSLEAGETREAFKQRVDGLLKEAGISEAETNTIFQTNTKSAYIAGQAAATRTPAVKSAFGYVLYVATRDTRTRPEHAALDGFCCSVDDPAYAILQRVVQDYGCRCTLIFLDEGQARIRGIKTMADIPQNVMAKYGVAA